MFLFYIFEPFTLHSLLVCFLVSTSHGLQLVLSAYTQENTFLEFYRVTASQGFTGSNSVLVACVGRYFL